MITNRTVLHRIWHKTQHKNNKNENEAKEHFDLRVKQAKRKAIEDNIKKARESGNKLTQTLTEDGKLINVAKLNSGTRAEDAVIPETPLAVNNMEVSSADIRQELFETDNISTNLTITNEEDMVLNNNENVILSGSTMEDNDDSKM